MFVTVDEYLIPALRAVVSALLGQKRVEVDITMLTSSGGRRPTHPWRLIVALMGGVSAVAFLALGTAYAHDPNRPELNAWFKSLKNKVGEPCCDTGDGQHAEAEWDMAKGGYKVLLRHPHRPNDVPYSAVIDQPNLSGIAMVWWWPSYSMDGSMTPKWRCFIPGAAG
jgi:hypothetical protein